MSTSQTTKAAPKARKKAADPVAKAEAARAVGHEQDGKELEAKLAKPAKSPEERIAKKGRLVQPEPETKAADDRVLRVALAKTEHAAVKAWRANGQKGDQPKTPNLDAVNADAASPQSTKKATRKQTAGGNVTGGKTQAGRDRMSDDEVVAWVKAHVKANAGATKGATFKAFKAAGFGANPQRFARLFETAVA